MRILILSGKSDSKNSLIMTKAFLQGVKRYITSETAKVQSESSSMNIDKVNIEPCKGCNSCWQSGFASEESTGKCHIIGNVQSLKQKFLNADLIIWSLPLYYYGPPSVLKAFVEIGAFRHRLRDESHLRGVKKQNFSEPSVQIFNKAHKDIEPVKKSMFGKLKNKNDAKPQQRHVLICACGFDTTSEYDSYFKQFDTMYAQRYVKILCPQGELISMPQMRNKAEEYLKVVRKAGVEFAAKGSFSAQTEKLLAQPMFQR